MISVLEIIDVPIYHKSGCHGMVSLGPDNKHYLFVKPIHCNNYIRMEVVPSVLLEDDWSTQFPSDEDKRVTKSASYKWCIRIEPLPPFIGNILEHTCATLSAAILESYKWSGVFWKVTIERNAQ